MIETPPVAPPAPAAPRKPSKLMVDLSAAIRSTAEAAREQALAQVDADVAAVVTQIRTGAKEGEGALRRRSDEDIAGIKEWSRAEIARIKEQTEHRIDARKITLDEELAGHAAAIDQRVGKVEGTVAAYHADMAAYTARLEDEDDPARLATMAESMPEPPALDSWADLEGMAFDSIAVAAAVEEIEADVAEVEAVADVEAVAEPSLEPEGTGWEPAEGTVLVDQGDEVVGEVLTQVAEATLEAETVEAEAETIDGTGSAWGEPASAWGAAVAAEGQAEADIATEASRDAGEAHDAEGDGVPRWAAGETPDGFPTGDGEAGEAGEAGDPVDRGAIMAALEAAAEAVVAAESAAESADQAEAAADVAETAAEILKGRMDTDEEIDPEAAAALSARMGAGGLEESYADRLASLLPSHAEGDADGEPRTSQVVVSGLVSVASIASFKRHLGRLAGVTAVAVASGPEGEFVFNVTHRPDVSFRDAVPTMPGFAARVTSSADGVVQVTARDPEAEG